MDLMKKAVEEQKGKKPQHNVKNTSFNRVILGLKIMILKPISARFLETSEKIKGVRFHVAKTEKMGFCGRNHHLLWVQVRPAALLLNLRIATLFIFSYERMGSIRQLGVKNLSC